MGIVCVVGVCLYSWLGLGWLVGCVGDVSCFWFGFDVPLVGYVMFICLVILVLVHYFVVVYYIVLVVCGC